MHVVGDQLVEPLLVVTRHVFGNVHASLVHDVAAVVVQLFQHVVFFRNRLQFHHRHVAALGEIARLIQHVSHAARHAGCEVAAGFAEHDDDAAGHVFAAVVAHALDHRDGARVAHRETLAGNAAEVALAGRCAVKHGVSDDDRVLGDDVGVFRRPHDDASARQALADIVVAVADQIERDAACEECSERLTGRAAQRHMDRVVLQALLAPALDQRTRQHGADGTVDVLDRHFEDDRLLAFKGCLRLLDQLAVENIVDRMLLPLGPVGRRLRSLNLVKQLGEVETLRLPMRQHVVLLEQLGKADDLVELGEAKRCEDLAHFLSHEEEVVDHVFRRALEALAQNWILRRDTDGAGVEMALAHHDAAGGNDRRRRKAELVGSEQGTDDDVAAGLQATIDLQRDPRP